MDELKKKVAGLVLSDLLGEICKPRISGKFLY